MCSPFCSADLKCFVENITLTEQDLLMCNSILALVVFFKSRKKKGLIPLLLHRPSLTHLLAVVRHGQSRGGCEKLG